MLKGIEIKIVFIFTIIGIIVISALGVTLTYYLQSVNLNNNELVSIINNQINQTKIVTLVFLIIFIILMIILGVIISKSIFNSGPKLGLFKATNFS